MKPLTYVTFVLFAFNIFFGIQEYQEHFKPISLTHKALDPVNHLFNSKLYLQEKDSARSFAELKLALRKIEELRAKTTDSSSLKLIEVILPDLTGLSFQNADNPLNVKSINERYVKMLLALSYIQVRYALACNETQNSYEMKLSLRRAMSIVKKALILSEGSKKDHEVHIYANMNDIVKHRIEDPQDIKVTLHEVLDEIESMEISFSNEQSITSIAGSLPPNQPPSGN